MAEMSQSRNGEVHMKTGNVVTILAVVYIVAAIIIEVAYTVT